MWTVESVDDIDFVFLPSSGDSSAAALGSLGYSNELYYSDPSNFGRDVDLGDDVVIEDLQNGDDHSCILSTDGDVKCWG